jgi:hypothetical protein
MNWMLVLEIIYGSLVCALLVAVNQPPQVFGRIMSRVPDIAFMVLPFRQLWFVARKGRLNVGDPAPGFSLLASDKQTRVELS